MVRLPRHSLLTRLLGTYLLFVVIVLTTAFVVRQIMEQQLLRDVQAADLALAQSIALDVDAKLASARASIADLSALDEVRGGDLTAMQPIFRAFLLARPDIDRVYWLDANGILRASVPGNARTEGSSFAGSRLFLRATTASAPVTEAGVVDLTTYNAVAAIAQPVRDDRNRVVGVVVLNLLLDDFSASLRAIADEQDRQGNQVRLSLVDEDGVLVASPEPERLLQPVLAELPGAEAALSGQASAAIAAGPQQQNWLFSAVPVGQSGWAVVVQRPAADALATVRAFNTWLLVADQAVCGGWAPLLAGYSADGDLPLAPPDNRPPAHSARNAHPCPDRAVNPPER